MVMSLVENGIIISFLMKDFGQTSSLQNTYLVFRSFEILSDFESGLQHPHKNKLKLAFSHISKHTVQDLKASTRHTPRGYC